MFYSPIHSAEERTTVLYQAVKVHFLEEVTLRLAEVIGVKPSTDINVMFFQFNNKRFPTITSTVSKCCRPS